MKFVMIILSLLLVSAICNFPIGSWKQKTISFNTVNNYMLQNKI